MAQVSNQAGLSTDAYPAARPVVLPKTGLSANHKKMLGISAATVLLGGAVGLAIANKPQTDEPNPGPATGSTSDGTTRAVGELPSDIDVAGKITETMSFEQAFEAAREEVGMGGAFNWHGRWYNTFEKEEWSSLSLEQRQEYTEMITGEKLPVTPYQTHVASHSSAQTEDTSEPTIIEGYLNGNRVMGLDFDRDGIIDMLVMDGPDGTTYRIVDATGNERLDTVYRYDSLDGELTGAARLDQPFVLSNDDFSQELEATMSREVINSILESDVPATTTAPVDEIDAPEDNSTGYITDASEPDDTYINNGDVRDMDE